MPDAPSMVELFEQIRRSWADEQRTWFPGRVLEFNRSTKMADIQPLVRMPAGQEMPTIVDVRVAFPGGVYWDLDTGTTSGETGIVLVGWRSWSSWRRSEDPSEPEDDGLHELDYATFLPGLWDDSYADAATLPSGAKVIASSDLQLGAAGASNAVVHDELLSALDALLSDWDAFLTLLGTWCAAVGAATGVTWTGQPVATALGTLKAEIGTVQVGIGANSYKSPTVKVED